MSALAEHQADYITEVQAACPVCMLMFSLSRSVDSRSVGHTACGIGHLAAKHKVTADCFDLEVWHYSLAEFASPTAKAAQ